MQKKTFSILVGDSHIPYTLRSVARSRSIRMSVDARGEVRVTKPVRLHRRIAQHFVSRNVAWITEALQRHRMRSQATQYLRVPYDREHRARALQLAETRLALFNQHYKLAIGKISIRNQRSRWGSCSHDGNLVFNVRLCALPPALADYLVVHELCHIAQHNHSPRFWSLVAETVPEYRTLRAELRKLPLG